MHNKVVVIGANSYIGSRLIDLGKENFQIIGTSSRPEGGLLSLNLIEPMNFDFDKISKGDSVVICAGISSPDACKNEKSLAHQVNVTGTRLLIRKLLELNVKVIFLSTDAVYGNLEDPSDESVGCSPIGEYAEMKNEIELHFSGSHLFKAIRLSYVFSVRDRFTRYLIKCEKQGIAAEIFHPFYRSFVYLDDVVSGILSLINDWENCRHQFINFGGPNVVSRLDFAETLRDERLFNLKFDLVDPGDIFFEIRPRCIAMRSPIFEGLLGRPLTSIGKAIRENFHNLDEVN